MKSHIFIILLLLTTSCALNEEKENFNESETEVVFLNCLNINYTELANSISSFLPTLYPHCDSFEISFKQLDKGQLDTIEIYKNDFINHYVSNIEDADSTVLNKSFYFDKLEKCSNTKVYDSSNSCEFYVGGIYLSRDKSLQFIRLYQEGEIEMFDMFIQIKNGEVEVLAVG